ncbi:MAG: cation:dicarboxylase symporter family transporter, partial [Spirochaetaceae bacterium]|nr:cation:dicarboxylase symporter family transporter [Spirochaetaceae bacterium]
MKAPYRYLLGIIIGLAAGFLLNTSDAVTAFLAEAVDLTIRISRYLLLPLIFFSLPVAVTRLRRLGILGSLLRRSSLGALIASAVLSILGTVIIWLTGSGRIAVVPGSVPNIPVTKLGTLIHSTLPLNGFRILTGEPSYL